MSDLFSSMDKMVYFLYGWVKFHSVMPYIDAQIIFDAIPLEKIVIFISQIGYFDQCL